MKIRFMNLLLSLLHLINLRFLHSYRAFVFTSIPLAKFHFPSSLKGTIPSSFHLSSPRPQGVQAWKAVFERRWKTFQYEVSTFVNESDGAPKLTSRKIGGPQGGWHARPLPR